MRVAVVIFCIAVAFHADIHAQIAPVDIEISDLQAARLLIQADRLEDAYAFLKQAKPKNENEWIERLYLLGRIEVQLGKPEIAIKRFEAILERRPDLTKIRLQLAAAYYASGLDKKAKFHFRSSLAENLPLSVETIVEDFLRQIDARKPWSASISASLLPEAKPKQISGEKEVLVNTLPFQLEEDKRPSSGTGVLVSTGVSLSPVISGDLRGLLAFSGGATIYERSEWNDVSIATDIGMTRLLERGSLSQGIRFGWQRSGNERFSRRHGVWAKAFWQLSDTVRFEIPVSVEYQKYYTKQYRNGTEVGVNPNVTFLIGTRSRIRLEARLGLVGAKSPYHRHNIKGLGLRYKRILENGISYSINSFVQNKRYLRIDPLIGKIRKDQQLVFSVSFSHQSIRYQNFAPTLTFSDERNRSNIPLNLEYRNRGMNFSLVRNF